MSNIAPPTVFRQAGFTLLEVLVALMILAITMAALIKGVSESAASTAYLRDKTFAHWVGMNKIAELQSAAAWPATGTQRGREEMVNRDWYWQTVISDTFDEDMRRLEVYVGDEGVDKDSAIAHLIAFLPRPAATGSGQ